MKIREALEQFFGVQKQHRADDEVAEKVASIRDRVMESLEHLAQLTVWK